MKICGITRLEDALAAARPAPTRLASTSGRGRGGTSTPAPRPRSSRPPALRRRRRRLRRSHAREALRGRRAVGRAPAAAPRRRAARALRLAAAPGDEGRSASADRASLDALPRTTSRRSCSTPPRRGYGGSGTTFDWSLAAEARPPPRSSWPVGSPRRTSPRRSGRSGPGRRRRQRRRVGPGREGSREDRALHPRGQGPEGEEPMSRASLPDERGRFGAFGGRFVPETLVPALLELEPAWREARADPAFDAELNELLARYAGRETPLTEARRMSADAGGCRVLLKREDLCHTGSHKINNTLGQVLLARRMGKKRIIAETGAGQHGVATATAAALFGLPCEVYQGARRRRAAGAQRLPHAAPRGAGHPGRVGLAHAQGRDERGAARLGDQRPRHPLHHRLGRRPAPLPGDGPRLPVGDRARGARAVLEVAGRLPDAVVACVGGGSNAMGIFSRLPRRPGGGARGRRGGRARPRHRASTAPRSRGAPRACSTARAATCSRTSDGQIAEAHSISAGLDYPGVGPEHATSRTAGG